MIVGRDAERVQLSEFLDPGGARAAILTGAAGIGKTALWEWATARAAGAGHLVLAGRAGAAEAQLLPVPTSLDALVTERVRSLSRDVLLIAAGTAASWRFTDEGLEPGALERAELAGVVIVDEPGGLTVFGGPRTVRAAHPLMSAAAYAALPAGERRALHQRLAMSTDDPVERGRHAALAATRADPRIAVALDAGVAAALAAGAPDIAVELSRLALAHTSADADRAARLDLLADALVRAGDSPGAIRAQREAIDLTPDVSRRARRRIRLAEIATEVSRRLSDRADASYAALLKYADQLDEAETRLLALLTEARASGDLSSIAYSLAHLPHVALWQGRLGRARQFAQEHLDVAEQGCLSAQAGQARHNLGIVLVYEGRLDEGTAVLASSLDPGLATNYDVHRLHGALGFAALSGGDPATAVGHFDRWHAVLTAMHLREPGYSRWHLDYLASLVATGRLADARTFLDHLDALVAASGRGSAGAVALSGRAMVHAASGELPAALAAIDQALAWYDGSPLRFDRARTLLIAGQLQRRAKAKRLAQGLLAEAHREFTSFGAVA